MNRRFAGIFLSVLGLVLAMAPAASAQMQGIVPGAITVVGEGSASAPAETASVIIIVGNDSMVYIDPMSMEGVATATAAEIDAAAVIDAIVASGIPADDIEVAQSAFQGEWGAGMPPTPVTIFVTVHQPTIEGLTALLETSRTAAAESELFVNQFSVMYGVEDCRSLNQLARADAVSDARDQADDQAAAMDVTAGNIVASRDTTPMAMGAYQLNSCNSEAAATPYSIKFSAAPFDPGQPAEVTVFVAVEIGFQIP